MYQDEKDKFKNPGLNWEDDGGTDANPPLAQNDGGADADPSLAQDDEEIEEIEKDEEGKDINHAVHQDVIVENDEHDDEQVDAIEYNNHKHYKNQTMGNSEFMQMARESLKGK